MLSLSSLIETSDDEGETTRPPLAALSMPIETGAAEPRGMTGQVLQLDLPLPLSFLPSSLHLRGGTGGTEGGSASALLTQPATVTVAGGRERWREDGITIESALSGLPPPSWPPVTADRDSKGERERGGGEWQRPAEDN